METMVAVLAVLNIALVLRAAIYLLGEPVKKKAAPRGGKEGR